MLTAVIVLAVILSGKSENPTPAVAEITINDQAFFDLVSKSVVTIINTTEEGVLKGSGVIISERLILTARHVVRGSSSALIVIANDEEILAEKVKILDNTDIAWIWLSKPIENAKPIRWNLSDEKGYIKGYAFGCWGSLMEITYSAGEIHRRPGKITFIGEKIEWALNGTTMLFFGFSGGPLVDGHGQMIGISFGANSDSGSYFIDTRKLYAMSMDPETLFK